VLQMTVVIFGSYSGSWVGLYRISINYEVGNVFSWFESFTGGEELSLICLDAVASRMKLVGRC
jgi:hypothetical protein